MKKIAITVGQFIHRKGADVLLNAGAKCNKEYELYIIGAEPTNEYLDIKEKCNWRMSILKALREKKNSGATIRRRTCSFFQRERTFGDLW